MLVRKLDQIRSRIPPEQLLYYQSEAGREAIHTEFRERLESMSQHEDGTHSPSAADTLERRLLDLTARSPRAISVCDPSGQHDAMETKFMRPPVPVTIGSRFGEWHVTWGYWTKHRLSFLVMVVRVKDEVEVAHGTR
jgi:hypothetical protein